MKAIRRPVVYATLLAAALGFAFPAAAQMYKWVDERGQVSYSNTPPVTSKGKVNVIEDRVSVYTPDPLTNRAMTEDATMGEKRRARLEAQKEAENRARERQSNQGRSNDAQRTAAYERCVADRRVECESILSGAPSAASQGYLGYYPPQYVVGPRYVPQVPFYVDNTPPPRVGVSTAPRIGIDDRPPVGMPPRTRPIGSSR